ncbi:MAG: hypothetical protein JW939_07855 [Candidatus Thermoplasmatota archaeon]|nr:hypothetical protein [Candidatus Thermoplasmatota archaeon]
MRRVAVLAPMLILTFLSFVPLGVSGAQEGTTDVNIERYIEFRIEYDKGDMLHLEARIEASPYPVSVFLIKGEEAYDDWIESEEIDLQDIQEGKNVTEINTTFQVVENFSERNTTFFQRTLNIGEKDTYFLIIALHRDASMTPDDALSRASQVDYIVDWKIEEEGLSKGMFLLLVTIAVVLFLAGSALMIMYFIQRRRYLAEMEANGSDEREGPHPTCVKAGSRGKRAPPLG